MENRFLILHFIWREYVLIAKQILQNKLSVKNISKPIFRKNISW
jgi:hypothetical protein